MAQPPYFACNQHRLLKARHPTASLGTTVLELSGLHTAPLNARGCSFLREAQGPLKGVLPTGKEPRGFAHPALAGEGAKTFGSVFPQQTASREIGTGVPEATVSLATKAKAPGSWVLAAEQSVAMESCAGTRGVSDFLFFPILESLHVPLFIWAQDSSLNTRFVSVSWT